MNRTFSRNLRNAPRGVTLVELAVVIAVIGILVAVAAPTVFRSIRRQTNQRVASEIAQQMRQARNQAMARGEAVVIRFQADNTGASAGSLEVFATSTELPAGGFQLGVTVCDSDTEDISTDACPEGSMCLGDRCWGEPARSCRQLPQLPATGAPPHPMLNINYRSVSEYTVPGSAEVGLLGAQCGNGCAEQICFSPDGRVERVGGGIPIAGGSYCDGENFVVTVGDRDSGLDTVLLEAGCGAGPDMYEIHSAYYIRAAYNGEIGFRSSQ